MCHRDAQSRPGDPPQCVFFQSISKWRCGVCFRHVSTLKPIHYRTCVRAQNYLQYAVLSPGSWRQKIGTMIDKNDSIRISWRSSALVGPQFWKKLLPHTFAPRPCLQSVVSWDFLWCPNPPCRWWTGERRLLCWSLSALLKLSYMRNPCKRTTFRVCGTACKFRLLRHKRPLEGPWLVVRVLSRINVFAPA